MADKVHEHGHQIGDHLYIHRHTVVHDLPAHVKLVALVSFVFVMVATPRASWGTFLSFFVVVAAVIFAARIPLLSVIKRMVVEVPFVIFAVLMPFTASGPKTAVGPLDLSVLGLETGGTLLAKSTLGVLAAILFAATTPARDILRAFETLKVPGLLVQIATFMLRYSAVVLGELERMRVSRESRGFIARGPAQWRVIAQSAGALFIRSYERGERVHLAMLSRGYTGVMPEMAATKVAGRDWFVGMSVPLVSLVLLIVWIAL